MNIDKSVLEEFCPHISLVEVQGLSIDVVGEEISRSSQGLGMKNTAKKDVLVFNVEFRNYYKEIKKEFYILICTDDEKYAELRNKYIDTGEKLIKSSISFISGVLAMKTNIQVGVATQLVALLFYGTLSIGKNAWCNLHSIAEPVAGADGTR